MQMWLSAIRLLLGPLLLLQGAKVRRDILRMPEPEGPRTGRSGQGNGLSVLLLGDSSIAGVGAQTQDQALSGRLAHRLATTHQVNWQVIGTTGWTTQDALDAIAARPSRKIDIAVLSLGVNDVTTETGIRQWLQSYDHLIETLRRDWQPRRIILSGLPPMGAFPALPQPLRWYMGQQASAHERALFKHFGQDPDIVCLPLALDLDVSAMAEDGFHPGPQVYHVWAEDIARVIQRQSQTPPAPPAPATDAAHPSSETEPSSERSRNPAPSDPRQPARTRPDPAGFP